MAAAGRQGPGAKDQPRGRASAAVTQTNLAPLIDFQYASRFHDGRLLLPFGKPLRPLPVDIHAGELLSLVVIDSHLPVLMLASAVAMKPFGRLCLIFFQVSALEPFNIMATLQKPQK